MSTVARADAAAGGAPLEEVRVLVQGMHAACAALHADALCLVEGPRPDERPHDWARRVRAAAADTERALRRYREQLDRIVERCSCSVPDP